MSNTTDAEGFKIWSNRHRAWWGWGGMGYTKDDEHAGMYSYGGTMRILRSSALDRGWHVENPGVPKNVAQDSNGLWFSVVLHDADPRQVNG